MRPARPGRTAGHGAGLTRHNARRPHLRRVPLTSHIWRSCRRDHQTRRRDRKSAYRLRPGRRAAECSGNGHTPWGSQVLSDSRKNTLVPSASVHQLDEADRTGNRDASAADGMFGTTRRHRAQNASRNAPCRNLNRVPAAGHMPRTIQRRRRLLACRYAVLHRSENIAALAATHGHSNCCNSGGLLIHRRLAALGRSPHTHAPGASKTGKLRGRFRAGPQVFGSARTDHTLQRPPDRMRNRSNKCFLRYGGRLSGRSGRIVSSFL